MSCGPLSVGKDATGLLLNTLPNGGKKTVAVNSAYYWPAKWASVVLLAGVCRCLSSIVVVCKAAGGRYFNFCTSVLHFQAKLIWKQVAVNIYQNVFCGYQ